MSPYDQNQMPWTNNSTPVQNPYYDPYRSTAMPQSMQRATVMPIICDQIQGKVAATIYPLYTNQEARLFDIEKPLFYIVKNENGTRTPVKTYKYTEVTDEPVKEEDMSQFVKMDDILDLITDTVKSEVDKKLSEISFKPSKEGK